MEIVTHIIEVYDNHDMKVTHYEYDGSTEDYFKVINKIKNKMQNAGDYYTKVVTIQEF